jgi:gliding motility-associated-like protein
VWKLSRLDTVITPGLDVTVDLPVPLDSPIINGNKYYRYKLPQTYSFSKPGTYEIPVLATHPVIENCNNTEEVRFAVTVKENPFTNFSISHSGCTKDTVRFTGLAPSNGYSAEQWNWTFPGGVTATGQQASHLFTSPGNHDVTLTLISAEGCVGDTTRTIPIAPPPTATFGIDPAAVCEGGNIVFTDTSSFTGSGSISSWYWDFGNGSTVNATNANAQTITYPTYGTFTVRHAVKVSDACVSDTVSKVVKVNARPRLGFNYPAGCLPEDGVVQFTSTTTVPDGQSLTAYAWTFGDPNATPANPNTSTLANPTHIYTSFGSYNITYSATTSEGCTKDTSVAATFNLRPQLAYPSIPPVCENVTGTISVAAASVTNGVTGTGIYRGPGTDAAGNFNPLVAGSGTHTIWYVFTSTGGCKDSISQTVGVYAKPRARFTYPAGGCLPVSGLVQFTNTTTIADGQGLTYLWNFGDANATPANPNTSTQQDPTHNYAEGTYSIKLTVNSSNGCVGDTTITASFSVRPQLAYTALNNLCENAGQVSVATASVTNGATGTGMYKGPGTNAAGSFNPQAAGPGTHTIWYIFTTAGGCKDSISQTLSVYAKPVVRFTYPAGGCLAIDGLVQFTNNTTIADGQALTYLWNFGDPNANAGNPNTSTLQNPTHNYADGNYAIKLTVNSANGCVGDTTINAAFSLRPQLAYPALAAACASVQGTVSVATATVTNGANGTGLYRGPGTDAAGNFSPSTAGAGTHTIWYVFTSNGGCKDSISQTILVRAKPRPMFTISPTGCLPVNGQVQFTNGTTISDGQPMTWAWNFGDPNANAGNPNTSTLQNPVHNYLEGNYSIKLTITTSNGCTADTTISTTLSVRPQLAYAALNNVCESVTGTVSVATATVTNGITGTGIYRGPGVNAAGNFSPSAAGPGTHTIWYVFTTAGGCKDSISNTVLVYPKPVSSFTATTNICRDQSATITDNSTIPSGTITSWQWDFGNGTNATNTNNNPFTISYATHNAYTVKLVTTSNNGCTSDPVTRTINVHPLPVADFSLPTAVCMPGGNASFTNLTSLPGNGALTYQWNFGDGSLASSTSSPTHVYNTSGPFSIRLTARSANGCTDDTVKVLSAFFSKPVAAFSASPDTLCQGTDNVFTDESTAPGSTIRSWSWNFGDNTTSSNPNPGKRYALPGTYNVQLTVTNAAGCVSDPFIDQVLVYLQPVIDAGPSFVVSQGTPIQFNPRANDSSVLRFSWSPAGDFSNPNVLRPTLVAMRDATYTLTAIGPGNCSATDVLTVKIFKPVRVPNAFTPNGDGINDTWILANLSDYPGATVEVFNRYGQVVHRAMASALPWDGKFKGSPLPVATYYYIIDLKNGFAPMQGSVTIIR